MTEARLTATKSGFSSAAVFNVSMSYSANSELLSFPPSPSLPLQSLDEADALVDINTP